MNHEAVEAEEYRRHAGDKLDTQGCVWHSSIQAWACGQQTCVSQLCMGRVHFPLHHCCVPPKPAAGGRSPAHQGGQSVPPSLWLHEVVSSGAFLQCLPRHLGPCACSRRPYLQGMLNIFFIFCRIFCYAWAYTFWNNQCIQTCISIILHSCVFMCICRIIQNLFLLDCIYVA